MDEQPAVTTETVTTAVTEPIDIIREPAASSRLWKLVPVDAPDGEDAPVTRKSARAMIHDVLSDVLTAATGRKARADTSGFKAYGDRWIAWWTNNVQDREGEFFTQKAIDDYIARVDLGIVPYPELWYWHIPGTKHGQADWLGRVGHYAVAAGTFDDSDLGRAAKDYYGRHPKGDLMSHGFVYDRTQKQGPVYHQFNTFEISNGLPARAAANPYTDFEGVMTMPLSDDKRKGLEARFGEDIARRILEATEEKNKALEDLGVAFKDFTTPPEPEAEDAAAETAVKQAETDLKALVADVTEGQALAIKAAHAAVTQVKTLQATVEAQAAEIAALKSVLDDRPRAASADEDTALTPERLKELLDNAQKQTTTIDPFWGTEVSEA